MTTSGITATVIIVILVVLRFLANRAAQLMTDPSKDVLTAFLNRRGFDHAVAETERSGDSYGAIIAINLDQFKNMNDRLGRAGGDRLLVSVAAILRSHCENFGVVARTSGDEFVILVKRSHSVAAETLAEALRVSIGGLALAGFPEDFRIATSIGLAYRDADEPIENACRRADIALYVAKGTGRNRVVIAEGAALHASFAGS